MLSMTRNLKSALAIAAVAMTLSACGRPQTTSRVRDKNQANQPITAAVETNTSGQEIVFGAAPITVNSMTYCIVDQNAACIEKPTAMTFDRTVGDRKIFRIPVLLTVSNSIWKLAAVAANNSVIEQKIKFKAADQGSQLPANSLNWKVLLMASDQGNTGEWINAFDNARKKLKELFTAKGVRAENFRELSLHTNQQSPSVKPTSAANFKESMQSFGNPAANDACIVHMTSHGSPDGFNLGSNRLSPSELDQALNLGCGNRPTVVLVSACYSGLYVLDQSKLKKPNRIILTAARSDLTSFGCSSENEYTYWDSCLIETLPAATKWKDLATDIVSCITRKEGGETASFPQTFIGTDVADLSLPK